MCGAMADVFSKRKRSEVMSRIRGSGNKKTELALIVFFRRHGFTGWRRRQKVYGKPDFVFRKSRVAVFVDGCFWHGCPEHCKMPSTNPEFWKRKLAANRERDAEVTEKLQDVGWQVLRIWEHELKAANEDALLAKVSETMSGQAKPCDKSHGRGRCQN